MKHINELRWLLVISLLTNCKNPDQQKPVLKDSITVSSQAPAEQPGHIDNGHPYFSYIIKKGDSLLNNVQSEKPLAFQGSKNLVIQLDSSHHLLVNATSLNIYLNEKAEGAYPIASNTGQKEASILGGWLEKDETRTSYSVQKGLVTIRRIVNDSCSGSFEGSFVLNGANYQMEGQFLHVKIN